MRKNQTTSVLISGGAGYIGSHVTLSLLQAGYEVVVVDNLSNSSAVSLERITKITNRKINFIEEDLCNFDEIVKLFSKYNISSVLHFAGLKSVNESVSQPLKYYYNNVIGSQVLLKAMSDAGVFSLVFSSSATVYGECLQMPISETTPVGLPSNPYGRSKLMVENILNDLASSDSRWNIAALRYFNPVGAHQSGLIGEDPRGTPNNLLPYISQVAAGRHRELTVFGNDYPTLDGTGVRDYIHVMDLAEGHLKALQVLPKHRGFHVWNLGTGRGYSVIEVIRAFEEASGCSIPYRIATRRAGDIATCFADPSKAMHDFAWKPKNGLLAMMRDTWRWQQMNPNGYK